ncbi:AsmA-like C-terminal region-containing protein [Agarivorans sp. 1_MG-2023]|uniref:AsmA-like C-terminal region-containing protein n=1 Tax=Agarivorans sp. 1_MG-2023 TaxID=3062634 RepID=UPI0026E2F1A3|nr:AsmA-like C-terminal region-containing protein [Agarivorans sp. 1_MG-2023]MDO6764867.1 AsmA-like C-terminal region-containing protein [Agarivorans sp. 1_MG-2023]
MKRFFDLLAILLLLLLATSVFFLFSFHPDRYKSDFLHWFNQQSDWQLNYKNTQWSLKQPLSLQAFDLELAKSGQAAILAKQATLNFALMPLLQGNISLDSLSIEQAQIALTQQLFDAPAEPIATERQSSNPVLAWLDSVELQQVIVKDSDFIWQDAEQPYRLERFELAIEDWQIDLDNPSPKQWQFTLHSSAQLLVTPWQEIAMPQLSLAYAQEQLVIDHIGADLLQGSVYASAELSNKQLRIREVALNSLRLEHFANQQFGSTDANSEQHEPLSLPELDWLDSIQVDNLLLNQISLVSQVNGHNLVLNKFTAEVENFQSPWPFDQQAFEADYAFIADEFGIDHIQFNDLTASGRVAQGQFSLAALRSQLFKGQLSLSLSYIWEQQALTLHQLVLANNEIPIQPNWLPQAPTDSGEDSVLPGTGTELGAPLQQFNIEQLELQQVKLLSYADQLPFSATGLNVELRQLELIKDGKWQSVDDIWQARSQVFVEAPELAYRGMVLSHVSMDLGSDQQIGYFNLYGELPLGQFELQGQALLDQENKPWQAELSGLLLDVSPLARLANNRDFSLVGDLELAGKLRGKLSDFGANIDGSIDFHSQLLQLPGADLEVTLDQIIESPRQYYEDPNPLIASGWPVFWQNPRSLPQGITQFTNLALSAELEQGKLRIAPQPLPGLRYQLTLAGEVDLAKQRFNDLKLVVADQPCWRLVHSITGQWNQPAVSFDHYLSPRRYSVDQQDFVRAPSIPQCRYPLAGQVSQ